MFQHERDAKWSLLVISPFDLPLDIIDSHPFSNPLNSLFLTEPIMTIVPLPPQR